MFDNMRSPIYDLTGNEQQRFATLRQKAAAWIIYVEVQRKLKLVPDTSRNLTDAEYIELDALQAKIWSGSPAPPDADEVATRR